MNKLAKTFSGIFATKSEPTEGIGSLRTELKQDIAELKKDNKKMEEKIDQILTIVENSSKPIDTLHTEYSAVSAQLDRHETWIKKSAPKIGLKFAE